VKGELANHPIEQFQETPDDEIDRVIQNTPTFSFYWEMTEWKEIRPVLRLVDLDPDEVLNALDVLALFYLNLSLYTSSFQIRAEAERAKMDVDAAIRKFWIARSEQEEFLINKITRYQKKRRRKSGKSELYPIIYL